MNNKFDTPSLGYITIAVLVATSILMTINAVLTLENAESKPFDTFDSFYPFYLSQHEDSVCKLLHFIGTSIIILLALYEINLIPSLLLSMILAYGVFLTTRSVSHGGIEMGVMMIAFLLMMQKLSGNWLKGVMMLVIGYSFAWVGHFFFEQNKPATFIYPLFSLMGDFKMWFEIFTLKLKV